jgi:hypothetical protein
MRIFVFLVALVGVTADHLRAVQNESSGRRRSLKVKSFTEDGSIEVADDATGDKHLEAKLEGNDSFVLTFKVGKTKIFQIRSSPKLQEIEIQKIGSKKADMTAEDRDLLVGVAEALEADAAVDTDDVDTVGSQSARMARLLSEWPETLDVDFTFDKDKEIKRVEKRANEAKARSVPIDAPDIPDEDDRRLLHNTPSQEVLIDENGHRRLAYTTICDKLYTYVQARHDDWWYGRWDDKTTYFFCLCFSRPGVSYRRWHLLLEEWCLAVL